MQRVNRRRRRRSWIVGHWSDARAVSRSVTSTQVRNRRASPRVSQPAPGHESPSAADTQTAQSRTSFHFVQFTKIPVLGENKVKPDSS